MANNISDPIETVTTKKQEMVVTGPDGSEVKVMATVTKTDHGTVDEEGNPKISVNINVPPITIGVTPGEVQ